MCNLMGYNSNMKKKMKADDYFNNGLFEVARFGNTVVTHNNMNEDQYKEWISQIANHYDEEKEEIDNLIKKIKSNLESVDPLTLFNFLQNQANAVQKLIL